VINLLKSAFEIQTYLEEKSLPFCFIGGIAVLQWGEIRVTNDVDIALLCGFGNEKGIAEILLEEYASRIQDAKQFAIDNRVLLLKSKDGAPFDIALTGLEFEENMINRSAKYQILPGYYLNICTPEDLIILKAFANRQKDWADIEGIVLRQKGKLQADIIYSNLTPLTEIKGEPSIIEKLKTLI
jgi:hypothetical protein